jgi:hypothetical protein
MLLRRSVLVLALALLATGCLPNSCQRERSQALMPSDSLSRRVAQSVPVDTLERLWTTRGPDAARMAVPRTVRFLPEGALVVSDAEANVLYHLRADGRVHHIVRADEFDVPYVSGVRGDTVVVFNAGADRFDFIVDGKRLEEQSLSFQRPAAETLVYTLATDDALYAKIVGEETQDVIARLDDQGRVGAQVPLSGPPWRHSGFLRAWGDSLVSLSGFRPIADLVPHSFTSATTVDSMDLVGFDSPMLERSHAFLQGDTSKPPLLTVSAAPLGDRLFVLNLRPGWLRVDVYDRSGRLVRVLTERNREGSNTDYPRDIAVRRTPNGDVLLAVARSAPTPQVELYRWQKALRTDA